MTQLAVQLYTLRSLMDDSLESFEKVIASVADKGYDAVETAGLPEVNASEIKTVLDTYGISVCSAHIGLMTLEGDFKNQVQIHKTLGNNNLVVPFLPPNLRASNAEEWKILGNRIAQIAKAYKQSGMQLLYHNHDFEMVSYEDVTGLEIMIDAAGTDLLNVELDLAWVVRGGKDPLKLLKSFSGHVKRVHVKDIAPEGENTEEDGWADVGYGTLDWATLLPAAVDAGAEAFIVEHDNPKNPETTIGRGIDFIKSV